MVLQRDNLHPLLDVAENIELPLRLEGRGRTQIRARVDQLLDEVGLADRRRHRTGQLSGGEAQRAAIAVALAPQPQVLLADEPTGELDESTAAGVLDLLATLKAREGASILTVTHNPQVAERADRRLIMRDGEILDVPEAPAIEALTVTRTYRGGGHEVRGVDSVSLAAARGEVVAVTGPSGSGKSTLLFFSAD